VCVAAAALAAATLEASSSKFFQTATQADFLKGEVDSLSVDARGQLTLGPAVDLVYEAAAPFVWAVVPGTDGSLFIGTGNEGKVYRVDSSGKGTVFFDSAELEIHAMAPAPNGGLYVATSPDGKIYRLDRNGAATTFFDPEDRYIWALTVDARGNVFAGTGDKGIIYRITPDGKGTAFYRTKSTHATALAMDRAGNLLVGTESPGKVIRVDADGKGFVLLDTPYQEIRGLRFDDKGQLYAAALNGRPGSGGAPAPNMGPDQPVETGRAPVPSVSVSTEITAIAVVDGTGSSSTSSSSRDDRRSLKGAVYRIMADGLWDVIWDSPRTCRTTSCSTALALRSSQRATRASCTASKANRCGRRCLPGPALSR